MARAPIMLTVTYKNWLVRASIPVSLVGLSLLILTAVLGFEEPNDTLLLLSAGLILAAPLTVALHLIFTKELSRNEKRVWLKAFIGSHAGLAFSDYLKSDNRRVGARKQKRLAAFSRRLRQRAPD